MICCISDIDADAARNEEQIIMLEDAQQGLIDTQHPKSGATPLHVASAKGYTDVIK